MTVTAPGLALYYEIRQGRVSTGYIYNRTEYDSGDGDYDNNIVFISGFIDLLIGQAQTYVYGVFQPHSQAF